MVPTPTSPRTSPGGDTGAAPTHHLLGRLDGRQSIAVDYLFIPASFGYQAKIHGVLTEYQQRFQVFNAPSFVRSGSWQFTCGLADQPRRSWSSIFESKLPSLPVINHDAFGPFNSFVGPLTPATIGVALFRFTQQSSSRNITDSYRGSAYAISYVLYELGA